MFKAQNIYTFFIENILVEFILSQNFSLIFMLWFSATLIPRRSRRIMIQVDPIFCDDLVTQAHWLGCHGMDELLEELRLYKCKPRAMTNNFFSFSNLDVSQCMLVVLNVISNAYGFIYLHNFLSWIFWETGKSMPKFQFKAFKEPSILSSCASTCEPYWSTIYVYLYKLSFTNLVS